LLLCRSRPQVLGDGRGERSHRGEQRNWPNAQTIRSDARSEGQRTKNGQRTKDGQRTKNQGLRTRLPDLSKSPDRIAGMFDAIAERYDFLNHLLSAGIDRSWRRSAVRSLSLTG